MHNYSTPPPGYTVGDELEEDAPLYTWRWDGERMAWVTMHDADRPEMVHPENLLLISETH